MAFEVADAPDKMPASDDGEEKRMITIIDTNVEEEDQRSEKDPNNKVCPNQRHHRSSNRLLIIGYIYTKNEYYKDKE
jgi:hypothetical protein